MNFFNLGKQVPTFYEHFPEIETAAKVFVSEAIQKKSCSFRILDLCEFIDTIYYDITDTIKETTTLIRSETAANSDLKRWGIEFGNSSSIYFEGHERVDVVVERNLFVDYFISRQHHYYTAFENESSVNSWISPTEKPCILLFHDESTFRCGEHLKKRWFSKGKEPFVSKGRGKSIMVSDFLIAHTSGPFFSLNESEWKKCVEKYNNIVHFNGVNYIEKTCTGSIQPGLDNYFNSDTILGQFERLFQMLEFKTVFNYPVKHDIEIVVDNARTHTAEVVNINEFRLKKFNFVNFLNKFFKALLNSN